MHHTLFNRERQEDFTVSLTVAKMPEAKPNTQ